MTEWVRERLALAAPPEDAAGRRERGLAALDALAALAARRPPPNPARFERLLGDARADRDERPRMGTGESGPTLKSHPRSRCS